MDNFEITQPTPEEIRALVQDAGLTRSSASDMVHASRRAWDKWTAKESSQDHRAMPLAVWELLLIKAGRHPNYGRS